ncbi:MAG: hypothetical protein HY852_19830 [Bradyrhizobium sp.]|uniref:hypothetical protein n=1 Tax=Bradyrhizobium sp. TaxID=376 RepID=UPI0025C66A5D|nr:hypothetical protein [Bradyrhizobium sp.]MBI5264058.1 hypothetical protein [Bradyrhizobium sp.]
MREFFRPAIAALSMACLASALALAPADTALAQAKQPDAPAQAAPPAGQQPAAQPLSIKQIALTDKQIEGVLSVQKDIEAITDKLPDNAQPDAKVIAQLDAVAKKHGFAGYDEYSTVIDNIGLVLGGFDPATRKYVGPEAVIKAQIAQIEADKKLAAKDKKEALDELNQALKSPLPAIENKGNIDVVAKYYDKLAAIFADDQD